VLVQQTRPGSDHVVHSVRKSGCRVSAPGNLAFDGLQSDVWGDERMGLEVRAESRRFLRREARLAAENYFLPTE
jgi:hypothetical protein